MDELQAAFLSIKLQILDQDNNKRIQLAAVYNELLEGIGDLNLPAVACRATSIYHIYTIRSKQRDELQKFLLNKGIGTMIHYPVPPHLQKAYKELNYKVGDFPISEEIANTTLSLPLYPGMSEQDVLSVIREIKKFFNG